MKDSFRHSSSITFLKTNQYFYISVIPLRYLLIIKELIYMSPTLKPKFKFIKMSPSTTTLEIH